MNKIVVFLSIILFVLLFNPFVFAQESPSDQASIEKGKKNEYTGKSATAKDSAKMANDHILISQLMLKWGRARDQSMWESLLDTFHPEGTIEVSWFKGPFDGFVQASKKMAENKSKVKHMIGLPIVSINGNRAVSETSIVIMARGRTGPVDIDITSYARFYDLLENRGDGWRILKRVTIYEKDRIDSVGPSFLFWVGSLFINFDKYPSAYKHLAYGLEKSGYSIVEDLAVDGTVKVAKIYQQGQEWLDYK